MAKSNLFIDQNSSLLIMKIELKKSIVTYEQMNALIENPDILSRMN